VNWRQGRWFAAAGALGAAALFAGLALHNGRLIAATALSLNNHLPYAGFSLRALADWRAADPTNAAFVGAGMVFAVVSVVIGFYQIFIDKTVVRDGELTRREARREAELNRRQFAEVKDMLAALQASRSADAPPPTAETVANATQAATELVRSGDASDVRAADLFAKGDVAAGFATLRAAAQSADRDAAERWRRLGALAYSVNVAEALAAYSRAADRDHGDFSTHIFIARLCGAAGRTPQREEAARTALAAAANIYERSIALDELGDVLSTRSDLTGALEAHEEGLKIARKLAADDPSNTERLRDVSVSLERIGDVLRTRSDLTGALEAYEEGLKIARKLAADDPSNAERLRDASVSLNKVGDVLGTRSDLTGALEAYEEGLQNARKLAADDPSNAQRQIDLGVSLAKLAQVAEARGDQRMACVRFSEARDLFGELSARAPDHHRLKIMAEAAASEAARVCVA